MKKIRDVGDVRFQGDAMHVRIDGQDHAFDLSQISKRLLSASVQERAEYEISPSGYGIHWPMIDEDLSIDGLLGIKHDVPERLRSAQP